MGIHETVPIILAILAAISIGFSWSLFKTVRMAQDALNLMSTTRYDDSMRQVRTASDTLNRKVNEFDDIIKQASNSNSSQGMKLVELENTLAAIDERVSMLAGSTKQKAEANPWQRN